MLERLFILFNFFLRLTEKIKTSSFGALSQKVNSTPSQVKSTRLNSSRAQLSPVQLGSVRLRSLGGVSVEFQFRWPVTRKGRPGRSSYEKHYAYARLHNFKWHAHNKPPTNFRRRAKSNRVKIFLYLFCLTNQPCILSGGLVNYLTSHPWAWL